MDLSKMRARTKVRKIAGQDVTRQDRSSKAFAKAQSTAKDSPYAGESGVDVEGNQPRPRLDRPARASGGRVNRAEGGSVDITKAATALAVPSLSAAMRRAERTPSASQSTDGAARGAGMSGSSSAESEGEMLNERKKGGRVGFFKNKKKG